MYDFVPQWAVGLSCLFEGFRVAKANRACALVGHFWKVLMAQPRVDQASPLAVIFFLCKTDRAERT